MSTIFHYTSILSLRDILSSNSLISKEYTWKPGEFTFDEGATFVSFFIEPHDNESWMGHPNPWDEGVCIELDFDKICKNKTIVQVCRNYDDFHFTEIRVKDDILNLNEYITKIRITNVEKVQMEINRFCKANKISNEERLELIKYPTGFNKFIGNFNSLP